MLRQRADDVDRELRDLVADLTDTMVDPGGAGIAAPQVGVGLRVFTWVVEGELGHVVDPTVQLVGGEEAVEREGCSSIPGLPFDCRRHLRVVTTGFTADGEPVRLEGAGTPSVMVQHETDHLDGILVVDRLDAATRALAEEAIR